MEDQKETKNSKLIFFVNGKKVEEPAADPEWTLLYYLRSKLKLSGAKLGCGEGGCGVCTVMVSQYIRETGEIRHYTVYACLTLVVSVHGFSITTTEGLGSTRTRLHPIQERIAISHGTQCGFCTPGFVMSMYALLRNRPYPSIKDIEENLIGNLCRCTGYRPIIEGFSTFSGTQWFESGKENSCQQKSDSQQTGCGKENCCQQKSDSQQTGCGKENSCQQKSDSQQTGCGKENCCQQKSESQQTGCELDGKRFNSTLFDAKSFLPYDSSQEFIFPPFLKLNSIFDKEELVFRGPRVTWFRPTSLDRLVQLKLENSTAKIIAGNTEISNDLKFKSKFFDVYISSANLAQLTSIVATEESLTIGASITLTDLEKELQNLIQKLPKAKTKIVGCLLEMLRWFGSKQIKNVATIGGNIVNKSPISDLNPILLAARADLTLKNKDGERSLEIEEYLASPTTEMSETEVLTQISIPFSNENEHFHFFKQSRRRTDDIAIVNAAMMVKFEPGTTVVKDVRLTFGGMDAITKLAKLTDQSIIGTKWDKALLEKAIGLLGKEFQLTPSAPGGMFQYRQTLVLSFFLKFFLNVQKTIDGSSIGEFLPHQRPRAAASQIFEKKPKNLEVADSIGQPIVHSTAFQHATGEATFVDDLPKFDNELQAAVVMSSIASGYIKNINADSALKMDGVVGFFSAKDLQGEQNITGILTDDEEVFASKEVKFVGHIIGVIVGTTRARAREAAKQVQIEYQELPAILTIEESLKTTSPWPPISIETGDIQNGFKESHHILTGEIRIGGQEHFYMETQTSIAIPNPDGEMLIYSATQNPQEAQRDVAKALGMDLNRVICKTRRIGGGFGGKEIPPGRFATIAAVAAHRWQRPVRLVLERDEDMTITGGRHPFLASWKVGFNNDGILQALQIDMFANAGYSLDISSAMATKAVLHVDNVYRIPNSKVRCTLSQTNIASNTACRGTGAPQSMLIMEDILTQISALLQKDPHEVRSVNMFKEDNPKTLFGQQLDHCTIRRCWEEVLKQSQYFGRLDRVKKFNSFNQFRKRGICAIPCKMAISYGAKVLEQAGALIHIYKDGTVLLSHGGIEMGQGLNTKMIQIASRELGIPTKNIYISENSTDKVPNASSTAASCASDLNGMAVKEACEKLVKRLEPYRQHDQNSCWVDCIQRAYNDRVSLSATGFYKTPGLLDFDFSKQVGNPYNYFTYGAGVTEVEVDVLTGDHVVLQTDIVMDVGESINPAIDIGQIEGAFTLGYGMYTLEEHLYTQGGKLITAGPSNYKIPGVQDIPCQFNVSLLRGSSNPRAIYSSRGIGEPPLFLAASAFFAIKEAVRSTLDDRGPFRLDSPATVERIRMACQDRLVEEVMSGNGNSAEKSWSVRV